MPIDFSALMYDPVYAEIGVPATMGCGVVDRDRRYPAEGHAVGRPPLEVRSVGPGAFARIPELAGNGITRDDYLDAVLTFNGRTWVVRSYELMGSPNGEDLGEVRFLLKETSGG